VPDKETNVRNQAFTNAQLLLEVLPRIPAAVQDAIDEREVLATSIREAEAERDSIHVAEVPAEWRGWADATERAISRLEALELVIGRMHGRSEAADSAVAKACANGCEEIHATLVEELGQLLARGAKAAAAFKGRPVPGGDSVPHLSPELQTAWRDLDEGSARYVALREGERRLRFLVGDPAPDPEFNEFKDPADPRLWGGRAQWLTRRTTGVVPGPSGAMDRYVWLCSIRDVVWLPDRAEEEALFESVRVKTTSRADALGAYVPLG
jgi:hypothetical protein